VCVCFYRFFPYVPYTYTDALEKLSLQSLHKRRHLDALFFVQVYRGLKSLNPALPFRKKVSLRVHPSNLRDFQLIGVCPSNKHCPSARCAYAANAVGKDLDIFAVGDICLNHICTHQSKIVNNVCSYS
jgi:hypothetical protein